MNELASMVVSVLPFAGNIVNVDVHVADDLNAPISNALVQVYTYERNVDRFIDSPRYRILDKRTDSNGNAAFRYTSVSSYIRCEVSAEDYYPENDHEQRFASSYSDFSKVVLSEHRKSYDFTLRRKKNPTSLYYRMPSYSVKLPKPSGEFGFDLMMNDWIEPYGEGKTADFYVQREASSTNSEVTLNSSIAFRGEGDGAYICKMVKTTSDFKTGYEADTNGVYQSILPLRYYPAPDSLMTYSAIVKKDEYVVLRTRVEKDAKGNIVKAHYSALCGAVRINNHFSCWGYVFNPITNDPNLEMNLEKSTDLAQAKLERLRQIRRKERMERKKNRLSSGKTVNPTPNDTNLEPK